MTREIQTYEYQIDVRKTFTYEDVGRGTDYKNPAIVDYHSCASQWWISQMEGGY